MNKKFVMNYNFLYISPKYKYKLKVFDGCIIELEAKIDLITSNIIINQYLKTQMSYFCLHNLSII